MKKKYLIALDMDGTLLNSERQICPETSAYLRSLSEKGHEVVICTGRPLRAVVDYHQELGLKTPIICYNGALTYNKEKREIINAHMLPSTVIKDLIEQIGLENFENILCENDSELYLLKENKTLLGFFWPEGMNVHIGDFVSKVDNCYNLMMLMKNHDYDDKLVKLGFSYPEIGIEFWQGDGLMSELYFLDVNKGSALQEVALDLGIPMENTIVFGDYINDLEMFDVAGISVAMKNAPEEVKSKAKMVAFDTNDGDGIKKTLEYLLATNEN